MDFESQVLESLSTINQKLDSIGEWRAGTQPICDRHTQQITAIHGKLFGNGNKGLERRLDSVEQITRDIRKIWMALIIAGLLGLCGLAFGVYEQVQQIVSSSSHIDSHQVQTE